MTAERFCYLEKNWGYYGRVVITDIAMSGSHSENVVPALTRKELIQFP